MAPSMSAQDVPLVSVIIPCFNAARWIGTTVESVRRQSWPRLEIIVVNDGSTDNSRDEIERIRSADMIVVDQENRGPSSARNRGLAVCRGDYVQYLDADDALAPNKLKIQVEELAKRPDHVAISAWTTFPTEGVSSFPDPKTGTFGGRRIIEPVQWLVENWREGGGMMYPAMWLLPRQTAVRTGPWREDLTLMDDTDYFTRVVLLSGGIIDCPGSLSYYRKGHASVSGLKTGKAWHSYFKGLESCTERFLEAERSDRTRRVASFLWQRFAHASYPYNRSLAEEAVRRAKALHRDRLQMPGGWRYSVLSGLLGWRLTRLLQVLSGRK